MTNGRVIPPGKPARFAYADPPYLGQARKHYSHDPTCAEVNHRLLIAYLREFDGWALSLSSPSLPLILQLLEDSGLSAMDGDYRVCAWVKPFAIFKPNVNPAYAWEPVIVSRTRKRDRREPTVRDWCSANVTLKRGLTGAKPVEFCFWLFELLGLKRADEFVDLFPGSGAVGNAFNLWRGEAVPQLMFDGLV